MTPTITSLSSVTGPTSGGDLIVLRATGLAVRIAVLLGDAAAEIVSVRPEGAGFVVQARTPAHAEAVVDVAIQNLDAAGAAIPGEIAKLSGAYRFLRPRIVKEADLTRLVRALLRELKRQVLENVSLSVAVEFDDTPLDGLDVVSIAKLPSLVLSGPRLKENRFYSSNEPHEEVVASPSGPELQRRRPAYTVDVEFGLTGASDRAVELLNLISAVAAFFSRNRWLEVARDPEDVSKGAVRWELDPVGELRTNLDGKDDLRAFTWALVVRGVDVDEGLPLDLGKAVSGAGPDISIGGVQ